MTGTRCDAAGSRAALRSRPSCAGSCHRPRALGAAPGRGRRSEPRPLARRELGTLTRSVSRLDQSSPTSRANTRRSTGPQTKPPQPPYPWEHGGPEDARVRDETEAARTRELAGLHPLLINSALAGVAA